MESVYVPKTIPEYIKVLSKRRWYFLVPFFSAILITKAVYPFLPRVYEASATLLVEDDSFANPGLRDRNDPQPSQRAGDRQIQLLAAQTLSFSGLSRIVKDMGLVTEETDPKTLEGTVADIRSRLSLKMTSEGLISLSYQDSLAHKARSVVNAVAQAMVEVNKRANIERVRSSIEFTGAQLRLYGEKLQSTEVSFLATKIDTDLADARYQRQLVADQLSQSERAASQVQVAKEPNPAVVEMRKELLRTESLLKQLLQDSKEENPMVREYRDKIETLRQRIQFEDDSRSGGEAASEANPEAQKLRRDLRELDQRLYSLQERRREMALGGTKARKMSPEEMAALERDRKINEDMYQSLRGRLENAQLSRQMEALGASRRLEVMDAARLPMKPVSPNPLMIDILGIVAALALGTAGLTVRELLDGSFRNVRDATEFFSEEPLVVFPRPDALKESDMDGTGARSPISPRIVVYHAPDSALAERCRLLRTALLSPAEGEPPKTILVTSSADDEGKTTVSVNLAVSMARELSKKVLLVDCDLRRGGAARVLGAPEEPGLSQWLTGGAAGASPFKETAVKGLMVTPSGRPVDGPSALFGAEAMRRLMEKAKDEFDFIILDAPTAVPAADVPVLMGYADGYLLVVRTGVTPRSLVREALQAADRLPHVRRLGYVLTEMGRLT